MNSVHLCFCKFPTHGIIINIKDDVLQCFEVKNKPACLQTECFDKQVSNAKSTYRNSHVSYFFDFLSKLVFVLVSSACNALFFRC